MVKKLEKLEKCYKTLEGSNPYDESFAVNWLKNLFFLIFEICFFLFIQEEGSIKFSTNQLFRQTQTPTLYQTSKPKASFPMHAQRKISMMQSAAHWTSIRAFRNLHITRRLHNCFDIDSCGSGRVWESFPGSWFSAAKRNCSFAKT